MSRLREAQAANSATLLDRVLGVVKADVIIILPPSSLARNEAGWLAG